MQCSQCGKDNPSGALFCLACSMPLQDDLLSLTLSNVKAKTVAAGVTQSPRIKSAAPRLIVIRNRKPTGEAIELPTGPYESPLIIGRNDLPRGIIVDVDLTDIDGKKRGVSRRHAQIDFDTTGLSVKDLGSAHGTFINKKRLKEKETAHLENGDEIMLANMILWLQMV